MKSAIPKKCPSCKGDMNVRLLRCTNCGTEVQGNFQLSRFDKLSQEQLYFLETFIACRGSLKDVGTTLDISYPTARNRLDSLIETLELNSSKEDENKNIEILQQVKDGTISAEDALKLLKGVKNNEWRT